MTKRIKKKIIIAGGSGFIGQNLTRKLTAGGYEVVILSRSSKRSDSNASVRFVGWDGKTPGAWTTEIENTFAVVNLAGESIAGENLPAILFSRWTREKKESILQSRLAAGMVLAEAISKAKSKPAVFIQASGIGFYGTITSKILIEDDPAGADFLARVSQEWEDSSRKVETVGVRRAVIRSGVVLDPNGGILPLVALPIRLYLGGPLGKGSQPFPWIHIEDEVNAIQFLIENPACHGAFNLVAPEVVSNTKFGHTLAKVLRRPFYLPVPAFFLRLMLGEKSILVLDGQPAEPRNLLCAGYHFRFPDSETALKNLFQPG
jgi:uncharacterized protein (TIGR01777 family)